MTKIIFLLLIAVSLLHCRENFYSDEVLSLYLEKSDTKAVGRLLPTNPFEIVKEENEKALVRLKGYVNPQAPYVIYFNDFQRILLAAFSKNTSLNFIKKVSKGKLDYVTLEVWTDKKDFAKDNQEMLGRAKELFAQNCGICHALHKEQEFNANQWAATFRGMVSRTGIDKKDHWLVIEYLQKNAKDSKGGK